LGVPRELQKINQLDSMTDARELRKRLLRMLERFFDTTRFVKQYGRPVFDQSLRIVFVFFGQNEQFLERLLRPLGNHEPSDTIQPRIPRVIGR
jgi:hypothetical protein